MGRSPRRWRLAVGIAATVGVLVLGAAAYASRTDQPARLEVTASAGSDAGSTTTAVAVDSASTTSAVPGPTPTTAVTTSEPSTTAGTTTTVETTTTAAATTTTTTTTVAGAAHYDGSYQGVEVFALFTGRCAFLDHHFVAAFTLADGSNWSFHQDYCGTVNGDLWSGVGTFAFTAADESTITGTVTEKNIVVPSPGVPYTIVVTGGTGRFAGATGSCLLDNHLRQIRFGLQNQWGTFACDIKS